MSARNGKTGVFLGMVFSAVTFINASAFGWGAYGHEQINRTAAKLLKNSELGDWLNDNIDTVMRLAITPDCEWKANRGCALPEDAHLRDLTYNADKYEHPLHFFEPDAFVRNGEVNTTTITELPDGDYIDVFRRYLSLFAANMEYVLQFPRSKPVSDHENPTEADVAENGTAPWRIVQLHDLTADALRDGNYPVAMIYLAAMGHYVGDMSQPFHATMNYDGQVHSVGARGIHAVFETRIMDRIAKTVNGKKDQETKLYSSYEATDADVYEAAQAALEGRGDEAMSHSQIISAVLELAATGHQYLDPLMDVFSAALPESGHSNAATEKEFMTAKVPKLALSVMELAEKRMGQSAALLSRLIRSAYHKARATTAQGGVPSGLSKRVEFDLATVLEAYPVPKYLPPGALSHGKDDDDEG